jgi:phage gpG-like protein
MQVSLNLRDQLTRDQIQKLQQKQGDWSRELTDIGLLLLRSVDKNFQQQGRPTRWQQSQAARNRNGMTLIDTGRLRRSTTISGDPNNIFRVSNNELNISSQVPYAKYLQKDRPFLMIQDEDIRNIERYLLNVINNL